MAEFTIPRPGAICWRELATKDLSTAIDFYSQMFGWNLRANQRSRQWTIRRSSSTEFLAAA